MNLKQEKYRRGSHDGEKLSKIIVLYYKTNCRRVKMLPWNTLLKQDVFASLCCTVDDANTEASADVECQGLMVGSYVHLHGKLVCIL